MEIVELIIEILSGLIIVIPLVLKLIEYVKKAATEKNWNNLIRLVMSLMATAEGKFDNGADRKEWVVAMVQASADTINYPISEKELRDLIDNLCALTKKVNVAIKEKEELI
jgi:methionyl-tRNA synthetase